MINAGAIVNNPEPHLQRRFLYNPEGSGPTVLQLGGSDPAALEEATYMACKQQATMGILRGVNLNCGCPSDKVAGKGQFGARLMSSPSIVDECVRGMRSGAKRAAREDPALGTPEISVKCRIGTDDEDSYEDFVR